MLNFEKKASNKEDTRRLLIAHGKGKDEVQEVLHTGQPQQRTRKRSRGGWKMFTKALGLQKGNRKM